MDRPASTQTAAPMSQRGGNLRSPASMATGALFVALASEVGNEFAIENDMEVDPIRGPKMTDGVRDGAVQRAVEENRHQR